MRRVGEGKECEGVVSLEVTRDPATRHPRLLRVQVHVGHRHGQRCQATLIRRWKGVGASRCPERLMETWPTWTAAPGVHELPLQRRPSPSEYSYRGKTTDIEWVLRVRLGAGTGDEFDAMLPVAMPSVRGAAEGKANPELTAPEDEWTLRGQLEAADASRVRRLAATFPLLTLATVSTMVWMASAEPNGVNAFVAMLAFGATATTSVSVLSGQVLALLRTGHDLALGPIRRMKPGEAVRLQDLLTGDLRLDLEDVEVRVVAYNVEYGLQHHSDGKSGGIWRAYRQPVRPKVLHRETIPRLRASEGLRALLTAPIDFAPAYASLLPPQEVGPEYGIDVGWEVQVLAPRVRDIRLEGGRVWFELGELGRGAG